VTDQEKLAIVKQIGKIAQDAIAANEIGAVGDIVKLAAQLEAEFMPPIDAPALDPNDRAAIDAEVDAEVSKT